jgi:hypothetical protein
VFGERAGYAGDSHVFGLARDSALVDVIYLSQAREFTPIKYIVGKLLRKVLEQAAG